MVKNNLVESFDQTGDIVSALVLNQIKFWYRPNKQGKIKLRVYRQGSYWLAKSHEDWWKELRITRHQVSRALKVLVSKGLIETKVMKFAGVPTVHIRYFGLLKNRQSIAKKTAILNTENTYIGTEVSKDTSCSIAWTVVHAKTEKEETAVKADEVLKKQEEKKTAPVLVRNTTDLVRVWERLVPKYHKDKLGGIFKPLTWKEKGQLSQFLKAIGKAPCYGVVNWTLSHWLDFSLEVKTAKGDTVPLLPQPGVLLKHWDIALRLYSASLQLTAKEDNTVLKLVTKQGVKSTSGS